MKPWLLAPSVLLLCTSLPAFGQDWRSRWGIGSPRDFGPYTGGHGYSYNVAYSYGFAFSPADTWRRDLLAYPAGPYPAPWGPYPPRRVFFPTPPAHRAVVVPSAVPALLPVPGAEPTTAQVLVRVPADAEVWVDATKTEQQGPERIFQSPPMVPGQRGGYTVRARWSEGGKTVEQFQAVEVQGGTLARVTFPVAGR